MHEQKNARAFQVNDEIEPHYYRTKHDVSGRSAPTSRKNNVLPEEQQAKRIELLNPRLADAIDLQLQSRQP